MFLWCRPAAYRIAEDAAGGRYVGLAVTIGALVLQAALSIVAVVLLAVSDNPIEAAAVGVWCTVLAASAGATMCCMRGKDYWRTRAALSVGMAAMGGTLTALVSARGAVIQWADSQLFIEDTSVQLEAHAETILRIIGILAPMFTAIAACYTCGEYMHSMDRETLLATMATSEVQDLSQWQSNLARERRDSWVETMEW